MKKTKKTIRNYYLLLATLLVFQAVSTVFRLSQTIYYQQQLNSLAVKKQDLIQERYSLEQQLGLTTSLAQTKTLAATEYQAINNPVILSQADQVAWR